MKYYGREMETIHPEGCEAMTWEDAEAMSKLNQENGWGFSVVDELKLIADHRNASWNIEDGEDEIENKKVMECIEWRLEDANFHKLCEALHNHDYKKAITLAAEDA